MPKKSTNQIKSFQNNKTHQVWKNPNIESHEITSFLVNCRFWSQPVTKQNRSWGPLRLFRPTLICAIKGSCSALQAALMQRSSLHLCKMEHNSLHMLVCPTYFLHPCPPGCLVGHLKVSNCHVYRPRQSAHAM